MVHLYLRAVALVLMCPVALCCQVKFGEGLIKFELPVIDSLTVPSDYSHKEQVDLSVTKAKQQDSSCCHVNFNGKNFSVTSYSLQPGVTYLVKIYRIASESVKTVECLNFLKEQGAILTGAQGLCLLYDLKPKLFKPMRHYVSYDKKDNLWKDSLNHSYLPMIGFFPDSKPMFELGIFEDDDSGWTNSYYLIAFFEKWRK